MYAFVKQRDEVFNIDSEQLKSLSGNGVTKKFHRETSLFTKYLVIVGIFIVGTAFGLFLSKFLFPNNFCLCHVAINQAERSVELNDGNTFLKVNQTITPEPIVTNSVTEFVTIPTTTTTVTESETIFTTTIETTTAAEPELNSSYIAKLYTQFYIFKFYLFKCKNVLIDYCAPTATVRSTNKREFAQLSKYVESFQNLSLSQDKNLNVDEIRALVRDAFAFLNHHSNTPVDICQKDDQTCATCWKRNADCIYSNNGFCNSTAEWTVIGYEPKKVGSCQKV